MRGLLSAHLTLRCVTSYLRILRALDWAKWHFQGVPLAAVNTNRNLGRKDEWSLLLKGSGGVSGGDVYAGEIRFIVEHRRASPHFLARRLSAIVVTCSHLPEEFYSLR
jgi:hypothetical protein